MPLCCLIGFAQTLMLLSLMGFCSLCVSDPVSRVTQFQLVALCDIMRVNSCIRCYPGLAFKWEFWQS